MTPVRAERRRCRDNSMTLCGGGTDLVYYFFLVFLLLFVFLSFILFIIQDVKATTT